jgi:hypothetical protein
LLALSGADVKSQPEEDFIEHLYPKRDTEKHFKRINKPMILITARVHPG